MEESTMIKIGIIGSDNSHADAFSSLINIPNEKTGTVKKKSAPKKLQRSAKSKPS